jgi:hypothetical protein
LEEAVSHRSASLFQSDSLFLAAVKPGQWASHPVYQSSVKAKAETPEKELTMRIVQAFTKEHPVTTLGTTLRTMKGVETDKTAIGGEEQICVGTR